MPGHLERVQASRMLRAISNRNLSILPEASSVVGRLNGIIAGPERDVVVIAYLKLTCNYSESSLDYIYFIWKITN